MERHIVTGAARGIGAALTERLIARGAEVTAIDLAPPSRGDVTFIKADLSDPASIDGALAQLSGRYDGLSNIAGLPPRPGNGAQVLEVNFLGLRRFADGAVEMVRDGGAVMSLASRAGAGWREGAAQCLRLGALEMGGAARFIEAEGIDATRAYNLSKEAVILWTFARAEALLSRGIRINSVSPAAVATDILGDFKTAFGPRVDAAMARVGRAGEAEEIAAICDFLLSDQASWLRGADIVPDGGISAIGLTEAMGLDGMTG